MKTGDIYFNRRGKVSIAFTGQESAFNSEDFDTTNKHAGLESIEGTKKAILMFNCTHDDVKTTGINIMDIINDPIIRKYLKSKCRNT